MSIAIDDYLSESERHEIAREVFSDAIRARTEESLKVLIANAAYEMVFAAVDERLPDGLEETLTIKVQEQLEKGDLSFQIFRAPDVWNRGPSPAYKALMDAVVENRDALNRAVRSALRTAPRDELLKILANGEFSFTAKKPA